MSGHVASQLTSGTSPPLPSPPEGILPLRALLLGQLSSRGEITESPGWIEPSDLRAGPPSGTLLMSPASPAPPCPPPRSPAEFPSNVKGLGPGPPDYGGFGLTWYRTEYRLGPQCEVVEGRTSGQGHQ